jgi:hypothetical protein
MVMGTLCHYLAQTTKSPTAPTAPSTAPLTAPVEAAPVQAPSLAPIAPATDEPEETAPGEADLDAEAAGHS